MKNYFFILFFLILTYTVCGQNEPEQSSPSYDTEIVRKCEFVNIEGKNYYDVVIILKSKSPDYFFSSKYKVKVLIKDKDNNTIYRKTMKNAYLYIFSNGEIHVGMPKFARLVIIKENKTNAPWFSVIREREGVY